MSNLDVIEKNARENHVPVMLEDGMEFLVQYIREHGEIVNILEIGTAVGLSSMKMAEIRETIHIDTLEVNEEMYKQAVNNIKENHLENQINVHLCDGALYHTDKIYDLIFVDAAKSQYKNYVEHFYDNTKAGSKFVFDNLNFHGIVDNPELTHNRSTRQLVGKIKKFREWIQNEPRFKTVYYREIGDGIAISEKL